VNWEGWEKFCVYFFGLEAEAGWGGPLNMHAVAELVVAVCLGHVEDQKPAVRRMAPSGLVLAHTLLGHLPHFRVMLDAEQRLRGGQLTADWSIDVRDEVAVVQTQYATGTRSESTKAKVH